MFFPLLRNFDLNFKVSKCHKYFPIHLGELKYMCRLRDLAMDERTLLN